MMTPNEIDKLQKECEYEALKEKVENLDVNANKNTVTINIEEYKELLDYKYKWLNHQCKTITITEPQKIENPYINPYTPYYPSYPIWGNTQSKEV